MSENPTPRRDQEERAPASPVSRSLKTFPHRLEVLQLVLDGEGRILTANENAREQFSRLAWPLEGTSLRTLLTDLRPSWEALLPERFEEPVHGSLFLPWEESHHPGLGWNLHCLGFGDGSGFAVSLVPGMAPEGPAPTPEECFSERVGLPQHNLFFRTRQLEARFRQFMRLLPGVPFFQDRELGFSYWTEQLRSLLGKEPFARLQGGANWLDWIHRSDRDEFEKSTEKCLRTRTAVSHRFRLHLPVDDRVLYLMEIRSPVRSVTGEVTGYEGLWLDLTRQTVAEKRLQRAAWKESLAEISGSLSHDFNNTLTGVVNLAELLCNNPEEKPIERRDVAIIRDSARQAQDLIRRIVALNRERCGEVQLHNLAELVEQQRELIRILLPRNVKFDIVVPEKELPAEVDPAAIRRALLNFATNSRDAVGRYGQVDLVLHKVELAQYDRSQLFSSRCGRTGPAAELIFRDNGCGIDPKILHRIFDPYFSTKQIAHGSGLGLYSLTRFAENNGFDFGVRTQPGEGTEMILLIPLAEMDGEDEAETEMEMETEMQGPWQAGSPDEAGDIPKLWIFAENAEHWLELIENIHQEGIQTGLCECGHSACRVLRGGNGPVGAFLILMDHRKELPASLRSCLADAKGHVQRILYLRGLNPDEVSHSLGDFFDVLLEEHPFMERNLQIIREQVGYVGSSEGHAGFVERE